MKERAEKFKWAVFEQGNQVSKAHGDRRAAVIEAGERGFIVNCGRYKRLVEGVEIEKVRDDNR